MRSDNNDRMFIPIKLAAVWGAFIHEGLMDAVQLSNQDESVLLDSWEGGCIELIIATSNFVNNIWQEVRGDWHKSKNICGVFEYDVVSPLGLYIGEHIIRTQGNLPSDTDIQQRIHTLSQSFFSK